jgi:hypothetical protein
MSQKILFFFFTSIRLSLREKTFHLHKLIMTEEIIQRAHLQPHVNSEKKKVPRATVKFTPPNAASGCFIARNHVHPMR